MWLRLLALVFGVTVYAASTVLAGFMAGLGLGSFVAGRLAARITRPLAAFGIAEVLVGITAFVSPLILDALTRLWVSVHPALPDSLAAITIIRFVVAFLVLIVPTSLMGATLPLVIKSAVAREDRIGGRIGLLYAINTTGAIVGALFAGFYLISEVGVELSFRLAAISNIVIGVVALAAAYAMPPQVAERRGAAVDAPHLPDLSNPPDPLSITPGQRQIVLWTFFVSGVMSLALEIIWFRMLVVFLRPTAYAFTIMLACVLAGIALGSALAALALRVLGGDLGGGYFWRRAATAVERRRSAGVCGARHCGGGGWRLVAGAPGRPAATGANPKGLGGRCDHRWRPLVQPGAGRGRWPAGAAAPAVWHRAGGLFVGGAAADRRHHGPALGGCAAL